MKAQSDYCSLVFNIKCHKSYLVNLQTSNNWQLFYEREKSHASLNYSTQIKIFVYICNLLVGRSHASLMDHFCLSQNSEVLFCWVFFDNAGIGEDWLKNSPMVPGKSSQLGTYKGLFRLKHDFNQHV